METERALFKAIVLAADRENANPVAKVAGVQCKSLAPIDGTPMIFRVLGALSGSQYITESVLCGPPRRIMDQAPELSEYVAAGKAVWMENQATPSLSASGAIGSLPQDAAVLVTTSDHALLTPQIVDYFCHAALHSGCDLVVALARQETVLAAYPQTARTAYRFKDGRYCSCNLFAFLTPQARTVPTFWRRIEQQRKNPLRVMRILGWFTVLRYILGILPLSGAMDRVSRLLGCKVGIVVVPFPEAAIDVDTAEDWHQVQQIATKRPQS